MKCSCVAILSAGNMASSQEIALPQEALQLLRETLKNEDVQNYKLQITSGSGDGDNFLGVLAKVWVKGKNSAGEDVSLKLIVKTSPKNHQVYDLLALKVAYQREIYFYTQVFPTFQKFQNEKSIPNPFRSVPRYINSIGEEHKETMILEDMSPFGFSLKKERRELMDLNHITLVLEQYGRFHAVSLALKDQKPEVFEELVANLEDKHMRNWFGGNLLKSVTTHFGRGLQALDPEKDREAYEIFRKLDYREVVERLKALVLPKDAGKYAVVNHGDCWINNFLFQYENESEPDTPTDICIIDWQLARYASPVLDLVYFIFASTSKETREKYYMHMLKVYHNSLSSFLAELGSDAQTLLPFDVLLDHMKRFALPGLYLSLFVTFVSLLEKDELPNVKSSDDNIDVKSFKVTSSNQEVMIRSRDIVVDYIRMGFSF